MRTEQEKKMINEVLDSILGLWIDNPRRLLGTIINDFKKENDLIEKPLIEVGEVYKRTDSKCMVYITKINGDTVSYYGFNNEGVWFTNDYSLNSLINEWESNIAKVTPKEWEERLDKERIRRGLVEGVRFESVMGGYTSVIGRGCYLGDGLGVFYVGSGIIMTNGLWATPIKKEVKQEDNKDKELKELEASVVNVRRDLKAIRQKIQKLRGF